MCHVKGPVTQSSAPKVLAHPPTPPTATFLQHITIASHSSQLSRHRCRRSATYPSSAQTRGALLTAFNANIAGGHASQEDGFWSRRRSAQGKSYITRCKLSISKQRYTDKREQKRKVTSSNDTATRRVTRLMTLDSTRRAVLHTSGLLENVLLHLPLRDLFVFQGVSKQWHTVIASSPGLQEKMFLRLQSATPDETWVLDGYDYARAFGSASAFRQHLKSHGSPKLRLARVDDGQTTNNSLLTPMTLNPVLRHFYHKVSAIQRVCLSWKEYVTICIRPAGLRRHSSLLDMHIFDPPCQVIAENVAIEFKKASPYFSSSGNGLGDGFCFESDTGLTIREILMRASESALCNYSNFDGGQMWKVVSRELDEIIDETAQPSGWTSIWNVEDITLHIRPLRHGNVTPLVVTEQDRVAVAMAEEEAAAIAEQS